MKKFLKIFVVFGLFFLFTSGVRASFEAKLQTDKTQIGVGDILNLNIEIKTDTGRNIEILDIKNLDKFERLGKSQSSSTETHIIMVNGQTKTQTITTYNLILQLRALQKGEFEIGPAIIRQGNDRIKTNSVLLKVGNGLTGIGKIKQSINNSKNNVLRDDIEKKQKIEKKYFSNNLSYIILFLVLTGVLLYIYKNKDRLFNEKEIEIKDEESNFIEENEEIEIEEEKKEIAYPDINDNNFEEKIDKIFREKVKNKYHLKNIESLTYEEILEQTKDDDIRQIVDLLNKIKYGNLIIDKTKVLELVKKI